jgi:drug/metabolite transporter (DMT)-like permease
MISEPFTKSCRFVKENVGDGFRLMLISTFFFGIANHCVKKISHIPPMEIVLVRCVMGVMFSWWALRGVGIDWKGNDRISLLLRGLFGTTALSLFFITVQNMPIATAMTVHYLSPIFTAILAMLILKEKVTGFQWLFYLAAFSGVLLIERVDTKVSLILVGLGVIAALFSGVAYNLVRRLRNTEHPMTVVLHFQFFGTLAGLIFLFLYGWSYPGLIDWVFLIVIGIASQLGQVYLTKALQREAASSVVIASYTGLIYAIVFGWIFFDEAHTLLTFAGMALVVLGVVASVLYSSNKRRRDEQLELTVA